MKKIYFTRGLALALLLVLLACTALAVGISQSARHTAALTAREALMAKYGLTNDTMGLLFESVQQEKDGYTVTFAPAKYEDPVGTYTARIDKDGKASVTWSHDGVDLAALTLASPAWGQAQLQEALEIERTYLNRDYSQIINTEEWQALSQMERQAENDRVLAEAQEMGMPVYVVHVLPGEGDMTEDEAVEAAKAAVMDKFGVDEALLDEYDDVNVSLYRYDAQDEAQYRVELYKMDPKDTDPSDGKVLLGNFFVMLGAQTGTVERCTWGGEPQELTLPDGPLDKYEEALKSFVEKGAFAIAAPDQKADIADRAKAAGFADMLPYEGYAAPESGDIAEAEALDAANLAMTTERSIPERALALYIPAVSLLAEEDGRHWVVDYTMDDEFRHYWWMGEAMGSYTVRLDAQTGETARIDWTLDDVRDDTVYTAETFGSAPAWDGEMLDWAMDLMEKCAAYIDKYDAIHQEIYPEIPTWTLEDEAAYDENMRAVGFDRTMFPNGLPKAGELTEDEAIALAKDVVVAEYGVDRARLDDGLWMVSFSVADPDRPEWNITLFPGIPGYEDYFVSLDAATGEVLSTEYIATGNG